MAKTIFPNTTAGLVSAKAVADPKHILMRPNDIVVLTGTDLPETLNAEDVVLTKQQFFYGLLTVGGQTLLNAATTYITGMLSTGTPAQKIHWGYAKEFRRRDIYTRQMRLDPTFKGAKSEADSKKQMDDVFIVGSGYEPPLSAG